MAQGLAGDSPGTTAGEQTLQLILVENRVTNQLLQNISPVTDELRQLRNDVANELGIPVPIPGN